MSQSVRFVFRGKIETLDEDSCGLQPSTTLLNYLRSKKGRQGTKEGCAEGDCGACTVVLAEVGDNGKLSYKAVDSCLVFLPMIHGKQLITVEDLSYSENGVTKLHPVQQCMIESSATQCGYCTPGFVMSLFAYYKTHNNPSRDEIVDAITGNLCRCTGYQPIIEAALNACVHHGVDHFTSAEAKIVAMLNEIASDPSTIVLETKRQLCMKPLRLQEALSLRKQFPKAIVVNGATDVALRQNKRNEIIEEIIDISDLKELKGFKFDDHQYIIGAGSTIEHLRGFSVNEIPALASMLSRFGSLQIRNLASIGGNICSASPIGDSLPVLFVLQARVVLQSIDMQRELAIADFISGYRKTELKPDELLTQIIIPKSNDSSIVKSYKVSKRKSLDISTVSAAFFLKLNENTVEEVRIAFGGMAAHTRFASATMGFLLNKQWCRATVDKAMLILGAEFSPIDDARSGAEYRRSVAANLLLKFFLESVQPSNNLS